MHIVIWVTSACNLACKYCYEGHAKSNEMMNKETADKILGYIEENVDKKEEISIVFHGGEPLLNFEIIKYLVTRLSEKYEKRQFKLTTNGTVMNQEIAQFLLDNFQNGISLSVDGNENTHNANRVYTGGQGSFDDVMNNLHTYFTKEQYSKFIIRMTLTPRSVDKLFDNCTYLINMGFSTIITALNQYDDEWSDEKFKEFQEQVYDIYQESIKSKYEENAIYLSVLDWNNRVKGECTISKKNLKIYVDGDIYPCIASVGDKTLVLGSIYREPFENFDLIEELCRINKKENPECISCKHKPFCVNSRCKLVNKAYNGDYLRPSGVECAYQNMIISLQNQI